MKRQIQNSFQSFEVDFLIFIHLLIPILAFQYILLKFSSEAEKHFILLTDTSYLFQNSRTKMD